MAQFFIANQLCSILLKSGEYGGRYITSAPTFFYFWIILEIDIVQST